jgi:hypothetical protein
MTIYTFNIAKSISKTLGLSFIEKPELSDQALNSYPIDNNFSNYATRGGGAAGSKNGHYGCKHTEETKQILRELRLGKEPVNKGIPNPKQREYWKKNNPMHNPETVAKVIETKRKNNSWPKGYKTNKKSYNYIYEMCSFKCDTCGKENIVRNLKGSSSRRFCNRSCQATFTNKQRCTKGYSKKDTTYKHKDQKFQITNGTKTKLHSKSDPIPLGWELGRHWVPNS